MIGTWTLRVRVRGVSSKPSNPGTLLIGPHCSLTAVAIAAGMLWNLGGAHP